MVLKMQSDIMDSGLGCDGVRNSEDTAISVKNLTKIYKLYDRSIDRLKESLHPLRRSYHHDFFALKDVGFEITKGETVGIIGRNGSGKSTLLKIIAGVLTPSGGNVDVRGKVSALLELGVGFNPDMTGRENVYLSGTIMGFSREEMDAKVDDILAFADIGDYINQPVKTYSSGMFVRLAFAMATNVDPDILIVDEALSVGDIFFQTKCYKKFDEFQQKGKTILFVTHAMENVIRYCQRGIVLENGVKLIDSDAKTAVDVYKKLMVNCYESEEDFKKNLNADIMKQLDSGLVCHKCLVNPDATIYGDGQAEIIDYGIFDKNGVPGNALFNEEPFSVLMKVCFKEDIENPIFAFTIKDLKGMEITGTNSLYENAESIRYCKGEIAVIEFSQMLNLASGQYLLSLGCTGFQGDQFAVYQRLYDILCVEVISYKKFVGFYDMKSSVKIQKKERTSA